MPRRLVSLVLLGVLAVSMGVFGCSNSHRGSSLEGPVAVAWIARSNTGDFAYAHDIAVDAWGNVYVAGDASTAAKDNDYLTI